MMLLRSSNAASISQTFQGSDLSRTVSFQSSKDFLGAILRPFPVSIPVGFVGSPAQLMVWMASGRNHKR